MWLSVKKSSLLGSFVTSQGVIDLYHFYVVVPTHVILFMITFWVSDHIVNRHKGRYRIGSGPLDFFWKWQWCLYDFKGHSSAFNLSQTIRYSKISLDLAVPFLCGSTNSCNIIYDHAFGYLIMSSRGMKAVFGIGSGPSIFLKWHWCVYDFKGDSSAFNLRQTIR